jgi:hypothetical protein
VEFRESNNQDENADHFGRFFLLFSAMRQTDEATGDEVSAQSRDA